MNNTLKILLILVWFIIWWVYQIYNTWKIYSNQLNNIKKETLNNKELVETLKNKDVNVNIWREIETIENIVKEKEKINEIYTWTINVIKEVQKIQKEQEWKINLLKTIIDNKNKEMVNKSNKIKLYDKIIINKQKELEKEATLKLNMDQFKKKTLYVLDWNKNLRDIYYNQIIKLKQFYSITKNNNKFINQLISLCDRTEYLLELKQIKCIVSSEDNIKSKLPYFWTLKLY